MILTHPQLATLDIASSVYCIVLIFDGFSEIVGFAYGQEGFVCIMNEFRIKLRIGNTLLFIKHYMSFYSTNTAIAAVLVHVNTFCLLLIAIFHKKLCLKFEE